MKKIFFVTACIFIFSLSACDMDHYAGQRPFDYPNTVWACKEANMVITIASKGTFNAETQINNKKEALLFAWSSIDNQVWICLASSTSTQPDPHKEYIIAGKCTFGKKQFGIRVVKVNPDYELRFPVGSEWIFIKTDKDF